MIEKRSFLEDLYRYRIPGGQTVIPFIEYFQNDKSLRNELYCLYIDHLKKDSAIKHLSQISIIKILKNISDTIQDFEEKVLTKSEYNPKDYAETFAKDITTKLDKVGLSKLTKSILTDFVDEVEFIQIDARSVAWSNEYEFAKKFGVSVDEAKTKYRELKRYADKFLIEHCGKIEIRNMPVDTSNKVKSRENDTRFWLDTFVDNSEQKSHRFKSIKSQIDEEGHFVVNGLKHYTPQLVVFLTSKDLSVTNMDSKMKSTINGYEYLKTYEQAYSDGIAKFENEFAISADTLYGDNAERYVKDIHYNYFHTHVDNLYEGWRFVKEKYPTVVTHKNIKKFGFYSGMISSVDEMVSKYPRLFTDFDQCDHQEQGQIESEKVPDKVKREHKIDEVFIKYLRTQIGAIPTFNLGNKEIKQIVSEKFTHEELLRNNTVDESILEFYYLPTKRNISEDEYRNTFKKTGFIFGKKRTLLPYPYLICGAYLFRNDLVSKLSELCWSDLKLSLDGNDSLEYLSDLLPYFKEYARGFQDGYEEFENVCIIPYLPMFPDKQDSTIKVFEYVTKRILLDHDWMNNHRGFVIRGGGESLKGGKIIKGFEDGRRQGYFYKAWGIIFSNNNLFTPLFQKRNTEKTPLRSEELNLDLETNPCPSIFKDSFAFKLFEMLHEDYKKSSSRHLANYSFIYRMMHEDKLILEMVRPEMFKFWLSDEPYAIVLDSGLKTLSRCTTTAKTINYNTKKEMLLKTTKT